MLYGLIQPLALGAPPPWACDCISHIALPCYIYYINTFCHSINYHSLTTFFKFALFLMLLVCKLTIYCNELTMFSCHHNSYTMVFFASNVSLTPVA